jgi:uncharacterized protein YegP (UPF0339 family)
MDVFKVYLDDRGEGRWRQIAPNGREVANGGEGYSGGYDAAITAARREAKPGDHIVRITTDEDGIGRESLIEVVGEGEPAEAQDPVGEVVDPKGEAAG